VSTVPRILIIIRVGRNTIHRSWIWTTHGLADVAISTFDDIDCANDGVRFLHRFPGGKLPGVMDFLRTHPAVIEQYDYFWLLDDDLVLPFDTLRRISALLARFPFDLSSPGLSYESFFSWPLTMANDRFLFRCTDFVEVMAPIMSRAFLRTAMLAFADNFSCWGHEWLWREMLSQQKKYAAIFDSAPIVHTRPFSRGSVQWNRPAGSIGPIEELEIFIKKYGLDRDKPFRNVFGVTAETPHRILTHDDFQQAALAGYRQMQVLPTDSFARCTDMVIRLGHLIVPYESLCDSPGFRMVQQALELSASMVKSEQSHFKPEPRP
jgi:hypothetical protein